ETPPPKLVLPANRLYISPLNAQPPGSCTMTQEFDPLRVPSPCFVVDAAAIEANLQILDRVQRESGAKVLLALKAFSMWRLAPLVMKYLNGVCASGVIEA